MATRVDHETEMVGRLPVQYRKIRIEAYARVIASEIQAVEDALFDLLTLRQIDTATDATLTRIGDIVGQPRDGITDDDVYRRLVRARIAANKSRGTPDDILRVARAVFPEPEITFDLQLLGTAAYVLVVMGPVTDELADILISLLKDATSAGVGSQLISSTVEEDLLFTLARAAFADGAHASGAATLLVDDCAEFPAVGTLIIDEGLATEESIDYTGRTGDTFTLDGTTAQNHSDRSAVRLDDGPIGLARAAFADGPQSSGAGTFTVDDCSAFDSSGYFFIDEGLASEEEVRYVSHTGTVFTLSGTTQHNHSDLSAVVQSRAQVSGVLASARD